MRTRTQTFILVSITALWLPLSGHAKQDSTREEVADDSAVRCINVSKIRRTKVVDDRTILFYALGKKAYLNILPRPCRGLARENRFSYATFSRRLCDLDSIQVMYHGGGMQPGRSCALGSFIRITREEANALANTEAKEAPPAPVPLPEPEEIGEESQDSEESEESEEG